jgi:CDP-glucose 4,6-dehydratase
LAGDWGEDARWETDSRQQPHEAQLLKLDCSKAAQLLDWRPVLPLQKALHFTADWYRRRKEGEDVRMITMDQITQFAKCSQFGPALA